MIDKRKEFIVNAVYFALILGIAVIVLRFAGNYLMPFIFGFLIAFILKPIIERLTKHFGERRILSIIVIIVFYLILAFLLFWVFIALIAWVQNFGKGIMPFYHNTFVPALDGIKTSLETITTNLDPAISDTIYKVASSLSGSLESLIKSFSNGSINFITGVLSSVPSILISILIAVIASFFFTLDYKNIISNVMSFIPERQQKLLMDVKYTLVNVIGKYIKAYAKLMSITFIELCIGFFIIGMSNPIGLAFSIAIVDILPVLGTGTVMIPWLVFEFIVGNTRLGVSLLIIYVFITVIRNILEPKIVGNQIGLHPLATLILIYVGMKLFGFAGLIGLPVGATIIVTLHNEGKISFFRNLKQGSKDTDIV